MGVEYLQFRAIQILSRTLPRRIAYLISCLVSIFLCAFDTYGHPAVEANLRRIRDFKGEALLDAELDRMVRQVYRGSAMNFVDFFHYGRLTKDDLERLFRFEGLQNLEESYSLGKGVIVLTAHFGCFDLGAPALVALGYPTSTINLPWKDPQAEALFARQRRRHGVKDIPAGKAARGSIETLMRGEVLAFAADFDYSLHDERVDFLGVPMRMPFGPARLAQRIGVPIVPCFVTRRPGGTYLARCFEPILPRKEETFMQLQKRFACVLERVVLEHPSSWFVFSDMWDAAWNLEIARAGTPRQLAAAARRAHRGKPKR
jgi:KDO2-lipid IV(A) lauroyltransferase